MLTVTGKLKAPRGGGLCLREPDRTAAGGSPGIKPQRAEGGGHTSYS